MADNYIVKDANGSNVTIRATDLGGSILATHFRLTDAGGNLMPAMDAVARAGFFKLTDGANTMPTMDVAARRGFMTVTDGTNSMPTMDAVGRRGFVTITDGTNSMPTMDAAARPGYVAPVAVATGGATPYKLISAASTNATNVKGSAGTVYGIQVNNVNAAVRYLKLYDKATAPTVGTDTPVKVIAIPAGASVVVPVPACGLVFTLGIGFALTTGVADADTGAVSANEHAVNLDYK